MLSITAKMTAVSFIQTLCIQTQPNSFYPLLTILKLKSWKA